MATPALLLAAAAAPAGENPYGLLPALEQGGVIAWSQMGDANASIWNGTIRDQVSCCRAPFKTSSASAS